MSDNVGGASSSSTITGEVEVKNDSGNPIPVTGTVSVTGEVEVKNDSGNPLPISGTVTTTPPSNASTNVAQVGGTAVDTNSGNKSAGTLRVVLATDQPQTTTALKTDSSATTQPMSAASLPLPSGASTSAKQPALGTAGTPSTDVISVQGVASGTPQPVSGTITASNTAGDVASAAADSGNPVKIGGKARTTQPTAVVDAQRVDALFDKLGKQIVVGSIRALKGRQVTTITASTAETTIVTADASNANDLYYLLFTNSSATPITVTIKDSTAGTTAFTFAVPATATVGFALIESAAAKQTAANTNWTATSSASVTSLFITALYVANVA